ncbi:class I SAM-dependent methyltransferase [Nonomuraea sp. NPDC049709]|uniref:class I SAM-dependent methyltransferase n=1 Tax=Nonomuraea sp. NPDC049709 TaxID=3154736 RepID=UPI00342A6686
MLSIEKVHMSSQPSFSASVFDLSLGHEPAAMLDAASWALAAMVATLRDAGTAPLSEVLMANPQRTAVLEAVGLVRRGDTGLVAHPSLVYADGAAAGSAMAARLSSLRQALSAAADDASDSAWSQQDDEVLLSQGRASAATGRALATRVVPQLPGLSECLDREGSRILDVGTGVAALALAVAREFPRAEVVGIDMLERVLDLGRRELARAEPDAAGRVSLLCLDVTELTEEAAYDLTWLPAPFLSEAALNVAVPRLVEALRPGGWIVVGTNPAAADPLRQAVAGWTAVRNGGNSYNTDHIAEMLDASGLAEVRRFPTVQGGPVLVAARRSRP